MVGRETERVFHRDRDYHLRGPEVDVMETVGRFRATFVEDLARETSAASRVPSLRSAAAPPLSMAPNLCGNWVKGRYELL